MFIYITTYNDKVNAVADDKTVDHNPKGDPDTQNREQHGGQVDGAIQRVLEYTNCRATDGNIGSESEATDRPDLGVVVAKLNKALSEVSGEKLSTFFTGNG